MWCSADMQPCVVCVLCGCQLVLCASSGGLWLVQCCGACCCDAATIGSMPSSLCDDLLQCASLHSAVTQLCLVYSTALVWLTRRVSVLVWVGGLEPAHLFKLLSSCNHQLSSLAGVIYEGRIGCSLIICLGVRVCVAVDGSSLRRCSMLSHARFIDALQAFAWQPIVFVKRFDSPLCMLRCALFWSVGGCATTLHVWLCESVC